MSNRTGNFRWTICVLLFFSVMINYLHRLTISVLKTPLSEMFGWNNTDVNIITGSIFDRTGSYVSVFAYFSGMYLLSLLVLQVLVPRIGEGSVEVNSEDL